jgi:GNAT superfamily N-acetyltransferase
MIGTIPKFQRQGAASMLVKWGLDYADDRGLLPYLEASPAGLGVSQNHGFKVVDRRRQKRKVFRSDGGECWRRGIVA